MRYLIIDLEKIQSGLRRAAVIMDLMEKPYCLSEEESLAKFKEVFNAGAYDAENEFPWIESEWEEFKKTL